MTTSKSIFELFIFINSFTIILTPLCVKGSSNNKVALFVFGDSLFDSGNNNYFKPPSVSNFWPYGETFFHHPTGRFSDGRIIPDFIADYMKLPFIPPYLRPGNHHFMDGLNFAFAGAGALVETRPGKVMDLKTQLSEFKKVERKIRKKVGEAETKKLLSKAIYMLSIGSNDYAVRVQNSTELQSFSREEYVGMVIGNLTSVIKGIHQSEGRKFGFVNVAPLSLIPTSRAISSDVQSHEIQELVKLHNKMLSRALKELQRDLKAFTYSEFDFYASVVEIIKFPAKFGFKEGEVACCGGGPYRGSINCGEEGFKLCENPNKYIFFDGTHPTDHANDQIANLMWTGSSVFTRHMNLKTLVRIRLT